MANSFLWTSHTFSILLVKICVEHDMLLKVQTPTIQRVISTHHFSTLRCYYMLQTSVRGYLKHA